MPTRQFPPTFAVQPADVLATTLPPAAWNADQMGAGTIGDAAFISQVAQTGYLHVANGRVDTLTDPTEVLDLIGGTALGTFQNGGRSEVLLEKPGLVVHVERSDYACAVSVKVAGADPVTVAHEMETVLGLFPELSPITADESQLYATYWFATAFGPRTWRGLLPRLGWSNIRGNYAAPIADAFDQLAGQDAPEADSGKVLLLTGPAGTGKSRLLFSLANEWAPWCDLHVVNDPSAFFEDRSYLMSVLERFSGGEAGQPVEVGASGRYDGRWGLLVFEDADAYIDRRQLRGGARGDGISSLLNMADGMLGQSMRVIFALTSNVSTEDIDPALTRPGRAMANLRVGRLSHEEAAAWLVARGHEATNIPDDGASLAELYDIVRPATAQTIVASGAPMPKTASRIGTGGSARFTTNIIARPIVASGGDVVTPLHRYPVEPPSDWFTKRQYSAPTPVVCTKAGQLFGHIWDWTKPHIGANGVRLLPPRNFSNYSEFQNKRVLCEDGQHVATGPVYIDIDHAPLGLTGPQAREWMSEMAGAIDGMNNTRCAVADVSIFDDEWGGQIAGALRPTCSPLSRRVFEGSDISPDWRASQTSRHQHEMYGLVSVNTSGLPVTQWDTSAIVASGGPVRRARRVTPGQVAYRLEEDGAVGTIVAVGMVRHDPDAGARRDELAELRSRVARHDALLANMAADAIMLDMEADAVMATLPPLA